MTSISLKVKSDQLERVLKALEKFEVSDVVISEDESFSESKSKVQESYASYQKGEKTFSVKQADEIIDQVIQAYEN